MTNTQQKVQVRSMEPEDIDAIFAIDRKISGRQRAITYKDLIHGVIGGQIDRSFVAEINGQVIGFVLASLMYVAEQVTEACTIQILGVDPDHWRQGIATKLTRMLLEKCRSDGIKTIRVMVDQNDSELQGFFKSMGFRRGRLIDYSTEV
ncbi:MAG: GNAT family N-acetyltransferase [Chloroflexota bacterium]|nr:GNAT family N-acetyltransferase [Chloroflexota bacterium]